MALEFYKGFDEDSGPTIEQATNSLRLPRKGGPIMDHISMQVPVFLPGKNRDWDEVAGIATITDAGEIHIVLQNKKAAEELVAMALRGTLYQCAFDYRMEPAVVKQINTQYKEQSE